jgi:hypothetical protein
VFWWGLACWSVIGALFALVVAGFVFIVVVVAS